MVVELDGGTIYLMSVCVVGIKEHLLCISLGRRFLQYILGLPVYECLVARA
jgi:hypothetical protein